MADWQQIIALALVGLAVAYLLRSLWGRSSGQRTGACGGCRKCGELEERAPGLELPLVEVEKLVSSGEEAVEPPAILQRFGPGGSELRGG